MTKVSLALDKTRKTEIIQANKMHPLETDNSLLPNNYPPEEARQMMNSVGNSISRWHGEDKGQIIFN